MVVSVSDTIGKPSHHLGLTYSGSTVGLKLCDQSGKATPTAITRTPMPGSSLKIFSGQQKHSDLQPPWDNIGQDDWSGGRGIADFDLDATRYFDSYALDTAKANQAILGPMAVPTTGYHAGDQHWPWFTRTGSPYYGNYVAFVWATVGKSGLTPILKHAYKFTASSSYAAKEYRFVARRHGVSPQTLTASIYSDNSGTPNTALESVNFTAADCEDGVAKIFQGNFTNAESLTSGTNYWFILEADAASDYWEVLTQNHTGGSTGKKYSTVGGWQDTDYDIYFRLDITHKDFIPKFFEYRGLLHFVQRYDDNANSVIYMNGDRGWATSGAANSLTNTSRTMATNEYVNCYVKLLSGTGSDQDNPVRRIVSNNATVLTVTPNWNVNPAAGTEYVILGSDKWTSYVMLGTDGPVKDALSVGNTVYFAMGAATNMQHYCNFYSGAWQESKTDNGTNKADRLSVTTTSANVMIWKSLYGMPSLIAGAKIAYNGTAAPTALDFTTTAGTGDIGIGDQGEVITNMIQFGDYGNLHIFKEGGLYELVNDSGTYAPSQFPISGMNAARDTRNGAAVIAHNVYLYFSFLNTLQRYYNWQLDGVGPDRDEGLPSERQGMIAALASYPGILFAAIDGGLTGYSSILALTETGWNEFYRSAIVGRRIRSLFVQAIPGDAPDRLWFGEGSDVLWLPVDLNPYQKNLNEVNPSAGYPFTWEGHLITSWYYAGFREVDKYFHALRLVLENVSATRTVEVEYQTDNATTWTYLGSYTASGEKNIDVSGKRIRFRIRLTTDSNHQTPRLLASVLECVTRLPAKYADTIRVLIKDGDADLNGEPDDMTADAKIALLETWAAQAAPVTVSSISRRLDGITGFIDNVSYQTTSIDPETNEEAYIYQLTLIEA